MLGDSNESRVVGKKMEGDLGMGIWMAGWRRRPWESEGQKLVFYAGQSHSESKSEGKLLLRDFQVVKEGMLIQVCST